MNKENMCEELQNLRKHGIVEALKESQSDWTGREQEEKICRRELEK